MPRPGFANLEPIRSALAERQVIITPTLRLARQIQAAWMAEQEPGSVMLTPRVMTLAAYQDVLCHRFAEREPELQRKSLSAFDAQWVFERVIETDRDFSNAFTLLQPRKAAQDAYRCREQLLHWQIDLAQEETRELFQSEVDCAVFLQWMNVFEDYLRRNKVGTQADRWRLLERSLLSWQQTAEKDSLVLFECPPLTPLEERVLGLTSHGLERVARRSGVPRPKACRFATRRQELKACAQWAYERSIVAAEQSTAVILLKPQQDQSLLDYYLREAFDCLDAHYTDLPVNYSGGLPLSKAPMYRDALQLLRGYDSAIPRDDWVALLSSPYLDAAVEVRGVGLQVRKALFDLRKRWLTVADVYHACQTIDHPRVQELSKLLQRDPALSGRHSAAAWRVRLSALLARWNWPSRAALDSVEYQQLQECGNLFDSFEVKGAQLSEFDFSQAIALLEQISATHIFQPSTEMTAIQVLGPQEVQGMQFDAVWVVGATADALPQPVDSYPFIPQRIQTLLRGGASRHEAAFNRSRDWLAQLLSGCHESLFSMPRYDGDVELPASVFVSDFVEIAPEMADFKRWQKSARDFPKLISIVDHSAGALHQQEHEVLGGSGLLREQAICPFRGWAMYRLGLAPMPSVELGLNAAERGTLLHTALEVFGAVRDGEDDGLDEDANVSRRIERAVDAALAKLSREVRSRVGVGVIGVERLRLSSLLAEWQQFEMTRSDSYKIVQQENTEAIEIAGLKLKLRVDRVDEFEDGSRTVIDYKSASRLSIKDWFSDRLTEPQLPLYSLLDPSVRGAAYAQVRSDGCQFMGVEEANHLPGQRPLNEHLSPLNLSSWDELKERWRGQLETLASEYQRGWARATPSKTACQHCAFGAACRVSFGDEESSDHDAE